LTTTVSTEVGSSKAAYNRLRRCVMDARPTIWNVSFHGHDAHPKKDDERID
jgi:hypothetical protein